MLINSNSNLIKFLCLGLPTWTMIDAIWASLSQLADNQPEGYSISSSLILALTLGNLIPLSLGIGEKNLIRRFKPTELCNLLIVIYIISIIIAILLSCTWSLSIKIDDYSISLPLLILFFFQGSIASTLNLIQFSLVSHFHPSHTTYLATGIGLGSMFAGILGLIRGLVLGDFGFNTSIYFGLISIIYIPAIYSAKTLDFSNDLENLIEDTNTETFNILNFTDDKNAYVFSDVKLDEISRNNCDVDDDDKIINSCIDDHKEWKIKDKFDGFSHLKSYDPSQEDPLNFYLLSFKIKFLIFLHYLNALFGFGFIPSIISYSVNKFPDPQLTLLCTTGFSAAIDPCFKFLTNYVQFKTVKQAIIASVSLYLLALGLILCSLFPLSSPQSGVLPALLYISFGALFGFTSTCFYRILKTEVETTMAHEHVTTMYRWAAMASQTGSMTGSIITFFIVFYELL